MITKELAKQLIEQAEYNCSGEKVEYNIDNILTPDGTLEIQKSVAGEAIAFLSDETAVNVRLIQLIAHGLFKFVCVLKVRSL